MGVERRLEPGRLYRAVGPLSLRLASGEALVLGFTARAGDRLVVPRTRTVVVKPLAEATVELTLGAGGAFEEARPEEEVVDEWLAASEAIAREAGARSGCYRVVVLGGVDVGKSSFSAFLANFCLERGLRVAVVDGDIGQADVGPPSCVSLARVERRVVSLRELEPESMRFVGVDSPGAVKHLVVWALHSLVDDAAAGGADVVIVNTDGWVSGPGAKDYKVALVQALDPDAVVAIQRSGELEHILRSISWRRVLRVSSPRAARRVPFEERRSLRESGYFRFLRGSKIRVLRDVPLMYSYSLSGSPLPEGAVAMISEVLEAPVVYAEASPEHLVVVVDGEVRCRGGKVEALRELLSFGGVVRILRRGFERGLLVGLLSDGVRCAAIGLLEAIDYRERAIKVRTAYEGEVAAVALGRVRLSEDGRELEKFKSPPL